MGPTRRASARSARHQRRSHGLAALVALLVLATTGCERPLPSAGTFFDAWARDDLPAARQVATGPARGALFALPYDPGAGWELSTCRPLTRMAECTWLDRSEAALRMTVDEASGLVVEVRRDPGPYGAAATLVQAWRAQQSSRATGAATPTALLSLFALPYSADAHWQPVVPCPAAGAHRACTWVNDSGATLVLEVDPVARRVVGVSGTYRPCAGGCPRLIVTNPAPAGASVACTPLCLADRTSATRLVNGPATGNVIRVDETVQAQLVEGFGYALTDSAAYLIDQVPNDRGQRDELLRRLFDPTTGIGLSWMRIVMGASDFTLTPRPWYSYRPTEADPFSISRPRVGAPAGDDSHIVPLLQQALEITHGEMTVFANPHSAPGWMKGNGDMWNIDAKGCLLGYCAASPRDLRDTYARMFVDVVAAYAERGIPIDAIGIQNEPRNITDYPGGAFSRERATAGPDVALKVADELDFVGRLDRAFAAAPSTPRPQILVEVDSWTAADQLRASPNRTAVDGLSYHCYLHSSEGLGELHAAFPGKEIHLTECTQVVPRRRYPPTIDRVIAAMNDSATSAASWNLALDPSGGPQATCALVDPTGCRTHGSDQSAPITVSGPSGAGVASLTTEYYEMGHFSKYVRPGARRVASSALGSVPNVAFVNPDGSRALVVHNVRSTSVTLTVAIDGGRHFTAVTLAPDAIATFTW